MIACLRHLSARTRSGAAFTLLELLGAFAIIALLLGVVAQSALARMQQANRDNESAQLTRIVGALERGISHTLVVPGPSQWVAAVAAELAQPASEISTNRQGEPRILLVDPRIEIGPIAGGILPYAQSAAGTRSPQRVRFLLVTSVGTPLPELSGVTFDALWDAPEGALPSSWPAQWPGNAADVLVARLDLEPLFFRVVLNNHDLVGTTYSVGTAPALDLSSFQTREFWLIRGSRLNLHYSDGQLQSAELVGEDAGFCFESGQWSRGLRNGRGLPGVTTLTDLANAFLNTASALPPSRLRTRGSPQAILHSFHLFMSTYSLWAASGFADGNAAWENVVEQLQAALAAMTSNSN